MTGSFPSEHGVYGTAFYLPEYKASYNWILNAFAVKEKFNFLNQKGIVPKLNISSRPRLFPELSKQGFACNYLDTHGPDNPFPLLDYIKGKKFKNAIGDIIYRARGLNDLLAKEKSAHERIWEQRDKHYQQIRENSESIDKDSSSILKEKEEMEEAIEEAEEMPLLFQR